MSTFSQSFVRKKGESRTQPTCWAGQHRAPWPGQRWSEGWRFGIADLQVIHTHWHLDSFPSPTQSYCKIWCFCPQVLPLSIQISRLLAKFRLDKSSLVACPMLLVKRAKFYLKLFWLEPSGGRPVRWAATAAAATAPPHAMAGKAFEEGALCAWEFNLKTARILVDKEDPHSDQRVALCFFHNPFTGLPAPWLHWSHEDLALRQVWVQPQKHQRQHSAGLDHLAVKHLVVEICWGHWQDPAK